MVMPYLSFSGRCEEAFAWYAQVFGGRLQHMSRYGDVPDNGRTPLSAQRKNMVMHAQLMLTETGGISGADALGPVEEGGAVQIHIHLESEAAARRAFEALSQGGAVLGELAANPPPDDSGVSGAVRDRYGFFWILSAPRDSVYRKRT